jgi:hypothetical protein
METINLIKVVIDPNTQNIAQQKPNSTLGNTQVDIGGTLVNNENNFDPFASKIKLIFDFKG